MAWQKVREYGKRNISELSIQRYKKIIGRQLHAREFSRQKNETTLGCGVLNRMTKLGMPISYRCALILKFGAKDGVRKQNPHLHQFC